MGMQFGMLKCLMEASVVRNLHTYKHFEKAIEWKKQKQYFTWVAVILCYHCQTTLVLGRLKFSEYLLYAVLVQTIFDL
jgi:hypothetical protein